jgi:acetyl-CoA acetyltransferase
LQNACAKEARKTNEGGNASKSAGKSDFAQEQRLLRDGLNDAFSDAHSGWHTEDLAEKYQVTREAQDRWALRSQQQFAAAQADGHFKSQIVPVEVPGKKGPTQFDKDEHNRPDTTIETLRGSSRPFVQTAQSLPATPPD